LRTVITDAQINIGKKLGRRTTLTKASTKVPSSLRTTVPNAYVEFLNLKDGDELNWELEMRDNNKPSLVVTKAEK
jgi:hypothetical protein